MYYAPLRDTETDAELPVPEESDRLYVLVAEEGMPSRDDSKNGRLGEAGDVTELLRLLWNMKASLILCCRGGGSEGGPSGNLLLRCPEGIPIRVKALLALAFPGCCLKAVKELDPSSDSEGLLPPKMFKAAFFSLLFPEYGSGTVLRTDPLSHRFLCVKAEDGILRLQGIRMAGRAGRCGHRPLRKNAKILELTGKSLAVTIKMFYTKEALI